ncbi:hypothetical protein BC629DRAFT_1721312 [Irpex lacteus]|nr:hypothetical protein BC629DRAFT_1721312 [Irpex lacteus]
MHEAHAEIQFYVGTISKGELEIQMVLLRRNANKARYRLCILREAYGTGVVQLKVAKRGLFTAYAKQTIPLVVESSLSSVKRSCSPIVPRMVAAYIPEGQSEPWQLIGSLRAHTGLYILLNYGPYAGSKEFYAPFLRLLKAEDNSRPELRNGCGQRCSCDEILVFAFAFWLAVPLQR